jgi:hypothetical protein
MLSSSVETKASMAMTMMAAMVMVMGVAVGGVMALMTTLELPAAERIAEAALSWSGGAE